LIRLPKRRSCRRRPRGVFSTEGLWQIGSAGPRPSSGRSLAMPPARVAGSPMWLWPSTCSGCTTSARLR